MTADAFIFVVKLEGKFEGMHRLKKLKLKTESANT